MKIKKTVLLIELLMVTSMVSIGFSSWAITNGNPASISIFAGADEVNTTQECIEMGGISFSDYGELGFVNNNSMSKSNLIGYLTYTVKIDLVRCRLLGIGSNIKLENTLVNNLDKTSITYALLSNDSVSISKTCEYNFSNDIEEGEYQDYSDSISLIKKQETTKIYSVSDELKFTNLPGSDSGVLYMNVNMKYAFTFSSYDNYSSFYNAIKGKGIHFNAASILKEGDN